jgi:hypothetical protein
MAAGLQDSKPPLPCFSTRRWLLIPLGAVLFLAATDWGRARQAIAVRDVDREAGPAAYAGGRHWLVVPEHNPRSYQWLAETEQMLAHGDWRVRHVDYENAPDGREVNAASPFRWWLGLLAWADRALTADSLGQSVEAAALWSGPLLHLLLLVTATAYTARRFGSKPAAFLALGLAVLFPLAGEFAPASPDDHGLALVCATWLVLFLADGLRGHRVAFIFSGLAGGLGLWVSPPVLVPVLGMIAAGALVLALFERRATRKAAANEALPWDRWALAGAMTSLLAYFAEYYPAHLALRLETNHPLYGGAWIGLGQLLVLTGQWSRRDLHWNFRTIAATLVAIIGLAALPVAMRWTGDPAFLGANPQASRLTNLTDSPVATNLATWLSRDGFSLAAIATLLPFALLVSVGFAFREKSASRHVALVGLTLLAAFLVACAQLQAWSLVQLLLLILVVTAWPAKERKLWLAAAFALLPGLIQLAGTARLRDKSRFSHLEIEGLIERDVAHWIADHAGAEGAMVLVAPERTPSFWFLGGLRGLGSPNRENETGVTAAVRILGATTAEEAQALLAQRGVTHLVLPSWDPELDEFVRWTSNNPNDTFLAALHRWALPPWLQPLPYRLPDITGMEGQSIVILQVTENSDRALALSRLAEYAVEVQDQAMVAAANDSLQAFPTSLSAQVARAQIAKAQENNEAFARALEPLPQMLANKLDRVLPWDRRVSLSVVLAQGSHNDLATVQLKRCVAEADQSRLRSLSAGSLYRLLVLSRAFNAPLPAELRDYALTLLPAEARARL